jgi:DNA-binding transcriptional MerR regulator
VTPRLYKASEVCEATGLQPYVLRSWEKEFPGIGVQKSAEAPRVYREVDVESVRRIKALVFGEGLTLAGARRRLEASLPHPVADAASDMDEVLDTLGADARTRIEIVRTGLRSILDVLSRRAGSMPVPELPRNRSGQAAGGTGSSSRRHVRAVSSPRRAATKLATRAASKRAAGRKASGKRKRASA